MDHWMIALWMIITYVGQLTEGEIRISSPTIGFLGEHLTLECFFNGDDRWFVIQWLKRRTSEEPYQPLLSLAPERELKGEWASGVEVVTMDRIRPYIRRKGRHIYFNLIFSTLQCNDPGEYKCQVGGLNGQQFAHTQLSLQAFPSTPVIDLRDPTLRINSTTLLRCSANVGLPIVQLRWYYKSEEEPLFLLIDEQTDQILKDTDDCREVAVKYLTIRVTAESDGTVYRCAADGHLVSASDPRYYDEITIRIPQISTETPSTSCIGSACYSKQENSSQEESSKSHIVNQNCTNLIILFIITTLWTI